MAMSIAQAQAAFLKEGGPVGGTLRSEVSELSGLEKMLSEYINRFLNAAANNLNRTNSVTTGKLLDSLSFELIPDRNGYTINFTALDYYKFVDKGVRGAKESRKNTTSPYKFKYLRPSKSHIQAIEQWIVKNNLVAKARDVKKYGPTSRESKALNPQDNIKDFAYIIAKSIKRHGLTATNFWTDAFDKTFGDFGTALSEATGKTITVNLQQMAEDIKGKGAKIPT